MTKFKSFANPELRVAGVQFSEGKFATDDPAMEATLMSDPLIGIAFGVEVQPVPDSAFIADPPAKKKRNK
jgi:hypothetical protein